MSAAVVNACGAAYQAPPYAAPGVTAYTGAASSTAEANEPVTALYGPLAGGFISNPATVADQGIGAAIPALLYVVLVPPGQAAQNGTTTLLLPGQTFPVPNNFPGNVAVISAYAEHRFTAVSVQPQTQYPPTPYQGSYPPSGPTGLTRTLPSYIYDEYSDDDDISAFIIAQNERSQSFLDWFNEINLPVYTGLSGALLDWVAQGLYGISRPTLYSGQSRAVGPINTYTPAQAIAINQYEVVDDITDVAATSDDVFKRILTWCLYLGDGRYTASEWIKRRVLRFLYGANGTDYEGPSDGVSVIVGDSSITITIITGTRKYASGAMIDGSPINTYAINGVSTLETPHSVPAMASIFKEAMDTGVLSMPYQYDVTCRIAPIGVQ